MIVNGTNLLAAAPIKDMLTAKHKEHGVSHGLAEAGYDIRIKQDIHFEPSVHLGGTGAMVRGPCVWVDGEPHHGRFCLASTVEEFQMPTDLVGLVKDKSTHARRGLSVFNTVIEPGWFGFLTLELHFCGQEELRIPAGSGIAQVLFHRVEIPTTYAGRYNGQASRPVAAIMEKG